CRPLASPAATKNEPRILYGPRPATGRTGALVHQDRKSTRLNSSHVKISYAVLCLKKKLALMGDEVLISDASYAKDLHTKAVTGSSCVASACFASYVLVSWSTVY